MRHIVFSLIFLLSAVCSSIVVTVTGVALSEEAEVKKATDTQVEIINEQIGKTEPREIESQTEVKVNKSNNDSIKNQQTDNQGTKYIVKEGDTLSEIAENTLGSEDKWPLLVKINHLSNPDIIFVGQKLILPADADTKKIKVNENKSEARLNENPDYDTDSEIVGSDEENMKVSDASEADIITDSTITGQIENSQRGSNTLIIIDENGDSHKFKLSSPDVLNGVNEGDTVEVEFKDGMAVSVVQKDITAKQNQMKD